MTNELVGKGRSLVSITDGFVGSTEFQSTYGSLTDDAFVKLLYLNVLGRSLAGAGGMVAAEAVARAGVEAGAIFDKNSALPMTLYTLPLADGA